MKRFCFVFSINILPLMLVGQIASDKRAADTTKYLPYHPDCLSAVQISDSLYGLTNVFRGHGKTLDYKQTGDNIEQNSAWFKFEVEQDTVLTFDLVPRYNEDDYDFALFKYTDKNFCNNLKAGTIKPVRFCFSYNIKDEGSTGLSRRSKQNFVNAGFGDPYAAALPVKKGQTYYLMINYPLPIFERSPELTSVLPKAIFGRGYQLYFYDLRPKTIVLKNVQFETAKATLLKSSFSSLDSLAKYLNDNPTMLVEIRGHTDNTGNEKDNIKLSQQRAESVVKYLSSKGIPKNNLNSIGYGSSKPIAFNTNEEGRSLNRRVEFVIIKK